MSCPELSKAKSKEVPKSILKKKSQFDQNSSGDAESYSRVKPVKSIRFSLDGNNGTNCSRMPSNNSTDLKGDKKKECQNKKGNKKRQRKTDAEKKTEETVRQENEVKKLSRDKSKNKNEASSKLVKKLEKDDGVKADKKNENESAKNSPRKDEGNLTPEIHEDGKGSEDKKIQEGDVSLNSEAEEKKNDETQQETQEESLVEDAKIKKKKRQRRGRKRRRKRKGKEKQ